MSLNWTWCYRYIWLLFVDRVAIKYYFHYFESSSIVLIPILNQRRGNILLYLMKGSYAHSGRKNKIYFNILIRKNQYIFSLMFFFSIDTDKFNFDSSTPFKFLLLHSYNQQNCYHQKNVWKLYVFCHWTAKLWELNAKFSALFQVWQLLCVELRCSLLWWWYNSTSCLQWTFILVILVIVSEILIWTWIKL